jgi:hypothetical protein
MPLDFPSSPTNGQVYNNFYYNSARGAWNALLPAATPNFFTNATLNDSTLVDATVTSSEISATPLVVKGISGQTANLQQWQDPAGSVIAFVDANGRGRFLTGLFGNAASPIGANLNIIPTTNSTLGLVIRGASSQTADLQQFQLSDSTLQSRISPSGSFVTKQGSYISASDGSIKSVVGSATVTPLIVQAAASQTADLQQWQSSTGAVLSDINSAGELQVPRIGIGSVMPTTTHLFVNAAAAANIPIIAQGAASQTGDLQRWQNSSGTVLADVDSLGNIQAPKLGLGGSAPPTSPSSTNLQVTGRAKILSNGSDSAGIWLTGSSGVDTAFIGQFNTDTTSPVGIYHNGDWRLLIDSLGRVRTPYQPAFYAQGSGTVVMSGTQRLEYIPFSSAPTNIGGHFNTSNSRFTAPVAGTYYFWLQAATTDATSTGPEIFIIVNGSSVNNVAISYNSAFYNTFGASYILTLQANDFVQHAVQNNNGTTFTLERGRSRFAGYLIG